MEELTSDQLNKLFHHAAGEGEHERTCRRLKEMTAIVRERKAKEAQRLNKDHQRDELIRYIASLLDIDDSSFREFLEDL